MRTLIKFGVWGVYFLPYSDHRPIDVRPIPAAPTHL